MDASFFFFFFFKQHKPKQDEHQKIKIKITEKYKKSQKKQQKKQKKKKSKWQEHAQKKKKKKKKKKKTTQPQKKIGKNNAHVHCAHEHFGQPKLSFSPLPSFLPIWRENLLVGSGRKHPGPTTYFPSPPPNQATT